MNASAQPRRIDVPQDGTFKLALVRRGPYVAARITHRLGLWSASINGQSCGAHDPDPFRAAGVSRIWETGTTISRAEYEALLRHPPQCPDLPIDLGAMPPISFEEPMNAFAGVGHNRPPIDPPVLDLHSALEPTTLRAWIAAELAPHAARADALLARFRQFLPATAAGIKTESVHQRAVDFAEQIRTEIDEIDATRVTIKAPVLAAQRAIDGAAKAISDPLLPAWTEVKARHSAYLIAKDAEIRRAAAEAAARAEEQAFHLQREAEETGDDDAFEEAAQAMTEQAAAEAVVSAPIGELTRMRTANGVSSALKDHWTYELADIAAVPSHFLVVNDAAVRAAIKGGARNIPGLTIRNQPRAR